MSRREHASPSTSIPLSSKAAAMQHKASEEHLLTQAAQRARLNPQALTPSDVVQLQRTIGNQGVQRLISGHIQRASDDLVEMEGTVKEVFPGGNFLVQTDGGTDVHTHLAGKLRRYRIRVVLGDRVTVSVAPHDLTKGRIVYRHK